MCDLYEEEYEGMVRERDGDTGAGGLGVATGDAVGGFGGLGVGSELGGFSGFSGMGLGMGLGWVGTTGTNSMDSMDSMAGLDTTSTTTTATTSVAEGGTVAHATAADKGLKNRIVSGVDDDLSEELERLMHKLEGSASER